MNVAFVIPVYNEEESLADLTAGIEEHARDFPHRILFVDDGSTDDSVAVIQKLRQDNDCIDLIKFRRNFGKAQALAVAFSKVQADVIIMMDADLQDDPKEIPRMIAALDQGYDLVCGWKEKRHDPWHKTFPSRFYNRTIAKIFNLKLHDINTGFKAMRIEVARALPLYGELHRMIAVHAAAKGFRVTEIPVEHHARRFGESKYGFERFTKGALDVLSTWFLTRHGQAPNHLFGRGAFLLSACGLLLFFISLIQGLLSLFLLSGASLEAKGAFLAVLLIEVLIALVLLCWGSIAFFTGFLAELIVAQRPPIVGEESIDERHLG